MALAIDGDIFQDAYPASLNPESEIYLILKIGGGCFVDRPDGELTVKTTTRYSSLPGPRLLPRANHST